MQRERYVCLEAATLEIPTGIAHKLRNVVTQFSVFSLTNSTTLALSKLFYLTETIADALWDAKSTYLLPMIFEATDILDYFDLKIKHDRKYPIDGDF